MTFGGDDALFREEETFGPMIPVFAFDTEDEWTPVTLRGEYLEEDGRRR